MNTTIGVIETDLPACLSVSLSLPPSLSPFSPKSLLVVLLLVLQLVVRPPLLRRLLLRLLWLLTSRAVTRCPHLCGACFTSAGRAQGRSTRCHHHQTQGCCRYGVVWVCAEREKERESVCVCRGGRELSQTVAILCTCCNAAADADVSGLMLCCCPCCWLCCAVAVAL